MTGKMVQQSCWLQVSAASLGREMIQAAWRLASPKWRFDLSDRAECDAILKLSRATFRVYFSGYRSVQVINDLTPR